MVGWALFMRHVTDLIGVDQSQTFGSQWTDPTLKQAYGLALDAINSTLLSVPFPLSSSTRTLRRLEAQLQFLFTVRRHKCRLDRLTAAENRRLPSVCHLRLR